MTVVYSLTDLTGRKRNENRRMVVMTFEVKRRTFLVSAISVAASLPVTGLVGIVLGVWALIIPVIAVIAGLWMWDSRQRKGLKLLNYQAIVDVRKASNGVLYAAGQPVPEPRIIMHQRQFVPITRVDVGAPVVTSRDNLSTSRARIRGRRPSPEARYL